jgi:hypothetical protein
MKPFLHAKSSAQKFGGFATDYLDIHDFMDNTKCTLSDVRHRAILHNAFGCFIVEKVFGTIRTNSDKKHYSPRDIAEQHIIEDLGTIPTVEKWLSNLPIEEWMGKPIKKHTHISFAEADQKARAAHLHEIDMP